MLSLPTVGPLLLRALLAQDMYLAGTIIMLIGTMTVIGTLLSDLILFWIDPRIRFAGAADEHGRAPKPRKRCRSPPKRAMAETRFDVATPRQLTWWRFRRAQARGRLGDRLCSVLSCGAARAVPRHVASRRRARRSVR